MKFDWSYRADSRIGKIPFPPLRWVALLFRNIYTNILHILPRSKNSRIVVKIYKDSTFLSLVYIDSARVNGAICEFGSHGYLAPFIARYLHEERSGRSFHVFDSFEGYPDELDAIDAQSPHVKDGIWRAGGTISPVNEVVLKKKLQSRHARSFVHKGYFDQTLSGVEFPDGVSLAIMDCNLYSSHIYVLDYLFAHNLFSEGATIMFADYNVHAASPEYSSRRAWAEASSKYKVKYSDEGPYNWGGRKFIIHGYEAAGPQ